MSEKVEDGMVKAIVLNDTRRDKFHIGCHEVMDNTFYLCEQYGIDVVASFEFPGEAMTFLESRSVDIDVVIVNGEGTFHDDKFVAHKIVDVVEYAKVQSAQAWLVNSIWQNNGKLQDRIEAFDYVFLRDSFSYDEVARILPRHRIGVMPDMSFLVRRSDEMRSQEKTIDWLVTDNVDDKVSYKLRRLSKEVGGSYFCMAKHRLSVKKGIKNPGSFLSVMKMGGCGYLGKSHLSKASRVITGRFHALTLAIKAGIPFAAVASNTHKIEALLYDMGFEDFPFCFDLRSRGVKEVRKALREFDDYWTNDKVTSLRINAARFDEHIRKGFRDLVER